MDTDERERRAQFAARIMDNIFRLVTASGGEWLPAVEKAYANVRRDLCSELGVAEDDVARLET